ncbi:hypothetical protein CLOHYLEM_04996 [[Clostridium] hylemonae DSM 15053]|uniref:Uncharacterized protein n=1 Tax=[Clostridium] hylemonae DSM 15053 TaxID=553973 RepID=C0BYV7_9FIRM|nr:hypothetical protein CLOHYLEM_04996 [[Clostridium] hylemonae DSM 15053]
MDLYHSLYQTYIRNGIENQEKVSGMFTVTGKNLYNEHIRSM